MLKTFRVVILMDASRAWERGLISGIAKYSHMIGPWEFLKKPAFFMANQSADFYGEIKRFDPDGIILREIPDMDRILSLGKPTIVSAYKTQHFKGASMIYENCEATGRLAAEHLLGKGLKSFAYCGIEDLFWSRQRCLGFVNRIKEAGMAVSVYAQSAKTKGQGFESEQPFLAEWLHRLPAPTGLMCCIDERSEQVAQICKSEDIHIPDDLAVIGVDNDKMICDLSSPPLSSVGFDAEGIGYKAAEMLDRLMKKRSKATAGLLVNPTCVMQRQSTDLLAIKDEKVAAAIRFIKEKAASKIAVDDVVRTVMLPRRSLERRFHRELGVSIYKEIKNIRASKAEDLLARTDMTISEIADAMGFADPSEFTRFYSRCRKRSPSSYRKKIEGYVVAKPSPL